MGAKDCVCVCVYVCTCTHTYEGKLRELTSFDTIHKILYLNKSIPYNILAPYVFLINSAVNLLIYHVQSTSQYFSTLEKKFKMCL